MIEHEVDSLPVVKIKDNGNYEIVGRLTKTSITHAFMDLNNGIAID